MDWADGVQTNPFVIVWRIDDCQGGGDNLLGNYLSCQWKWKILYRGVWLFAGGGVPYCAAQRQTVVVARGFPIHSAKKVLAPCVFAFDFQ